MRRVLIATFAISAACRHHEDIPAAEQYPNAAPEALVVMSKDEALPSCSSLGVVEGKGNDPRNGYSRMRTQAALRGANYVVIDGTMGATINSVAKVYGRAFRCPPSTTNVQASPPDNGIREATRCVPSCSPGFVCIEDKCVSACNPPCEVAERCGADRLCHPK